MTLYPFSAALLPLVVGAYRAINPLPAEGTSDLTSGFQPLLDSEKLTGVRITLVLSGSPEARGTSLGFGNPQVLVSPGAERWAVRHEIAHIKHNDRIIIPLANAVAATATATLFACLLPATPPLAVFAAASAVGLAAMALVSQQREGIADDFATANSSPEDLRKAKKLFEQLVLQHQTERETSAFAQLRYSLTGDVRIDVLHPSLTSRIQKLEQALKLKSA